MKVKEIGCIESREGYWEINRMYNIDDVTDEVTSLDEFYLRFIYDGEDYTDKDVDIKLNTEKLEDLVEMIKMLDNE